MVQVRAPRFKYRMSLSGAEAARVGFHNDCFLIDETDSGTYLANAVASDKSYLAGETLRVAMGGETCSGPTSRSGATIGELARFHWSYINNGFHADHLNQWRADGRYTEIDRRLGYRLQLVQSTLQNSARPGDAVAVDISIQNSGFAAPFNPRLVQLVLRSSSGAEYRATLPTDPRSWTADGSPTHHIAHDVCLAGSIPAGSYELFIHLADPAGSLHDRPEYAIRLANQGVWESSTGYNRLQHTLTVTDSAEPRACAPGTVTVN
jgi:hypothetical protein